MTQSRAGIVWLAEEVEQLKREFAEGLTLEEIVDLHGRTPYAILARLEHLKLIDDRYHRIEQDPWITRSELNHLIRERK
jgi:hypothetical protein